MSSASILARKIADEKPSVIRPATGPKPNSLTQKIAMITSWKRASDDDEPARREVDGPRREIARRGDAQRHAQDHADQRRGERHLQALDHAADEEAAAREVGRDHAHEEVDGAAEAGQRPLRIDVERRRRDQTR